MARDRFRDAASILATYEWETGHSAEDPQVNSGNLERTALTTGAGFVRQQGAPSPKVVKLSGTILDGGEQKERMEDYYNACQGIGTAPRTVFWQDITGTEYEVLITDFSPQRVAGKSSGSTVPYVYTYTITMEVIS